MNVAVLAEAELDRLAELLDAVSGGKGMNLEQADGYLAALLCTPTLVPLDQFLPPLFGAATMDELAFNNQEQAQETIALLMRHRNFIAATLMRSLTDRESIYEPLLLEDEDGVLRANDWAIAFLRGTKWDRQAWADLLGNEQQGGALIALFALAHEHEHDPDPSMRPGPVDQDRRDTLLAHMTAGLVKAYAWFEPQRRALAASHTAPQRPVRAGPKVGRNEPCPCGSGRKYKHCHGAA